MTVGGTAINQLSERIIGGAFKVANALGTGFLEKVYENALAHELRKEGLRVQQQVGVAVHYDGIVVGEYSSDLLIENTVIVELKAIKCLDQAHVAQCLNYLRATDCRFACCSISGHHDCRYGAWCLDRAARWAISVLGGSGVLDLGETKYICHR